MKRLGMVLLGLMFWSVNTLAQEDCGTPPRVLAPGKHSVLLLDQPFVVQWQDDDKCLGDAVKIELGAHWGGRFEVLNELQHYVWNNGYETFDGSSLGAIPHGPRKFRIRIRNVNSNDARRTYVAAISKEFTIKAGSPENTRMMQMTWLQEDVVIRDLLIRLTAMEKQSRWLIKLLAENDGTNNTFGDRYPEGISESWDDNEFDVNGVECLYSWQCFQGESE